MAFSPDGKLVVSGSSNQIVRLWNAKTGAELQTLKGHSDSVSSVAFSPGGKLEHTLFVLDNWLGEVDTNIVWPPPGYRATCVAICKRIIVLGHASGRISFFEFNKEPKAIGGHISSFSK